MGLPMPYGFPSGLKPAGGSPDNTYTEWAHFYSMINRANNVIALLPNIVKEDKNFTEPEMKALLGEAYFLRAFTYFNIAKWWKDAPLIVEPITNISQNIEVLKIHRKNY